MKSFKKIILCLLLTCTFLQTASLSSIIPINLHTDTNNIIFLTGGGTDNGHD